MATRPVYFDCDTGIDDALALVYLMASPEISLAGIGTVSGNIDAAQAAVNTLDLLAMGGRDDVAVAVGAMNPLARPFTGGVPHIHGRNGVGNVELPHTEKQPENESAADMLVRLAHEHEGELVVIAIGPLTNLALALQQDPSIAGKVHEVVIMGGAALVPGNLSAVGEANIWNDPEAAQIVMQAPWQVVLVPLDVTLENYFEEDDRLALAASDSELNRALADILDLYFDFYVAEYGRGGPDHGHPRPQCAGGGRRHPGPRPWADHLRPARATHRPQRRRGRPRAGGARHRPAARPGAARPAAGLPALSQGAQFSSWSAVGYDFCAPSPVAA